MTEPGSSSRLARALIVLSALMLLWALAVAVTGGFRIEIASLRISSRNASRIFLLAALPAAIAWRLAYRDWLEIRLQSRREVLRRIGFVAALAAAGGLIVVGALYGSRTSAASDPSGYVSQAALWASGTLKLDWRAAALPWPDAPQTLTPLGYRINTQGVMVPTYASGVPMLMALGRMVSACGPYVVGPICGALLVLFTFQLGRPIFGAAAATAASVLVACSPVVVFMSLLPMSDVPAGAFWVGALATAVGGRPVRTLGAGGLTAIAVLIRPNLVPLAVFPWLMAIVNVTTWRERARHTALFTAASLPGAIAVGWINATLYGSPLTSGYGDLGVSFGVANFAANLRRYPGWWLESQGLFAFLFVGVLWRLGRRRAMRREVLVLVAFAVVVALLYLFYIPFDAWWYLRFVVPAIPIALLLCADTVVSLAGPSATVRCAALAAFTMIAASHATRFIDTRNLLDIGTGERRYLEPALHISSATPPDAVIFTAQHSGSVRYYTGRLVVRWDSLDPAWLDRAVAFLTSRGLASYFLVESWEEEPIRSRFAGQRTLTDLDRTPIATAREGDIRLYALQPAVIPAAPVVLPITPDRTCYDISTDYLAPRALAKLR